MRNCLPGDYPADLRYGGYLEAMQSRSCMAPGGTGRFGRSRTLLAIALLPSLTIHSDIPCWVELSAACSRTNRTLYDQSWVAHYAVRLLHLP